MKNKRWPYNCITYCSNLPLKTVTYRPFPLTWPAAVQINFWTKEIVYATKMFNSHRYSLEYQHGRLPFHRFRTQIWRTWRYVKTLHKFGSFANLVFLSSGPTYWSIRVSINVPCKNGQHCSGHQKTVHFNIGSFHRHCLSIYYEKQTHIKCCGDSTHTKLGGIPSWVSRTGVIYVSSGACPVSSNKCPYHSISESNSTQARNLARNNVRD